MFSAQPEISCHNRSGLRRSAAGRRAESSNLSETFGRRVSGSSVGSPASSLSSSSSRQFHRQRITRVNLRDFIFYLEQERETSRSLLLYRALLK
ncbi:Transcription initiation factor TFIID subunit 4 [Bagarius yarrelli]|uniref:Transcription initiation factor TFIID subunit 4 n=1 Tax=Bagarius yarrelli TaxID=175774 RepID=A0A556TQN5_BAGYA|nr:Transcription initiation factor TFIID subunit 4 [Bagarius yarrelli]